MPFPLENKKILFQQKHDIILLYLFNANEISTNTNVLRPFPLFILYRDAQLRINKNRKKFLSVYSHRFLFSVWEHRQTWHSSNVGGDSLKSAKISIGMICITVADEV